MEEISKILEDFVRVDPRELPLTLPSPLSGNFEYHDLIARMVSSEMIGANSYFLGLDKDVSKEEEEKFKKLYRKASFLFFYIGPLGKEIKTLRGLKLGAPDKILSPTSAYVSTTFAAHIAVSFSRDSKCCVLLVTSLPGVKVFNLSALGLMSGEKEILLDKGGHFYMDKVEEISGKTLVYLRYISGDSIGSSFLENEKEAEFALSHSNRLYSPSIWGNFNEYISKEEYIEKYEEDVRGCSVFNDLMLKKRARFRAATYNVHEWKNARGEGKKKEILQSIRKIDGDVTVVQECDRESIEELKDIYPYQAGVQSEDSVKIFVVVLSKKEFEKENLPLIACGDFGCEIRNCIKFKIKTWTFYGVHLSSDGNFAKAQYKMLTEDPNFVKTKMRSLVIGDFNLMRGNSYSEPERGWLKAHKGKDSLLSLRDVNNKIKYTSVYGRKVDNIVGPLAAKFIAHSGTYFVDYSDHLPYFKDLEIPI